MLDQLAGDQVHGVGSSGRSSGAWCWIKWPELRCIVLDQVAGALVWCMVLDQVAVAQVHGVG